jgi:hypothetical protein
MGADREADAMLWQRQGMLLRRPEAAGWWASHAQAVTPLVLEPRRWRLYFSGRDAQNRSRILFVDVDPLDGMRILDRCFEPVLDLGSPGAFDSAGQGACSALLREGVVHLYYVGVHLRRDVPYGLAVGLAASADGQRFERLVPGPVLSTGPQDAWFSSAAHVTDGPDGATAWYTSGTGWVDLPGGGCDPVYELASATSPDGIVWRRRPSASVGAASGAGGLTRPWAAPIALRWRLFYAERGVFGFRSDLERSYRLRHVPLDAAGLPCAAAESVSFANPPAPEDWDGFMQAYPSVLPLAGGHVMFYNGNGFGRDGFGWATLGL